MDTNFESAKKFVDMKIKDNNESLSGPGSHIYNTVEVRKLLTSFIKEHNIKSILDLGCGDWNWFKLVNICDASYEGWDAHPTMININKIRYGSDKVVFEVKDIITEDYPEVDLIICRDVLFHLDFKYSINVINKIKNKCKYFLSTSFNNIDTNTNIKKYCHIDNWGFYPINLHITPFNLKNEAIVSVLENESCKSNNNSRYINIYDFSK